MKELEKEELMATVGGYQKMPPWVKGGLWFGIFCTLVQNWADIKSGITDGWTDAMKD